MKLLALDTSTEYCSAALWLDGTVDQAASHAGQRHSELLLPMVHALLARHGLQVRRLDGIAFGAGPGSFTGLRIACGVAQGLAYGAGLKLAAVSTLLALAQASEGKSVIAALDARMGEIYHAAYCRSAAGAWCTVSAPCLVKPESAPPVYAAGSWLGVGSGFLAHGPALRQRYGAQLEAVRADAFPGAAAIAALAAPMFERDEVCEPAQALPVYLRDKVAFTERERASR